MCMHSQGSTQRPKVHQETAHLHSSKQAFRSHLRQRNPTRRPQREKVIIQGTQDLIPQSEHHARLEGEEGGELECRPEYTSQIIIAFSSIKNLHRPFLTHYRVMRLCGCGVLVKTSSCDIMGRGIVQGSRKGRSVCLSSTATHCMTSFCDKFLEASTLNLSSISSADPNHAHIDNFLDEENYR
ncbi:hypothetical protein BDR06DRAFT_763298 [Suillus hirtellus]|nr:hypothetical protein BDR06DRAFT_763298 [Suillus hirtellus]